MRTRARIASTFAAVAASALLMTGCGGGSDDDGGNSEPEPTASGTPEASQDAAGGDVGLDALQGGWITVADADKPIILGVFEESITVSAETACTGTIDADASPMTMSLVCEGDGTEFTSGTVTGLTDGELTIEWASGEEYAFGRPPEIAETPELPSEFPSEMPTDLPDLPETES
ncbi:hypothetical protein [Streptomyces sp. GSL17-111]|uniref:hypothetical protein n=1 Tax=Streptomyces sp. GSL17-111 TaxID=3121596 RepID=UPI0030F3DA18